MLRIARRSRALARWSSSGVPSSVLLNTADGVATITLHDPSKLNALNVSMAKDFGRVIDELCDNCDDVGAVVLTGSGRAFSAGGDLAFLDARAADTPSRNSQLMRRFYESFLAVRRLPVPVVAAINGPAIGAGLCLALACDVRVAARDAKMGITFVNLGLHPGMGATHFLPRLVGPQIASRMMLTGEVVDGAEAERVGLVAQTSVDGESALADALALAQRMAASAPLAVRGCVRSLRIAQDEGLDRALWREADAQAQVWNSRDMAEGLAALKEKRAPSFADFEHFRGP